MSGFIAVSVSLIGLSGVLFTLAIFIQMILSFPAMLSSNSQTYVQQQRKAYTICPAPVPEEFEMEVDAELEDEPETELELELDKVYDDSVERWIDVVDEARNMSCVKPAPTQISQRRPIVSTRAGPITRGRSWRRRRRTTGTTTRPGGLRLKNTSWRCDEQRDYDFETDNAYETEDMPSHERQRCNPAWRNSMAR